MRDGAQTWWRCAVLACAVQACACAAPDLLGAPAGYSLEHTVLLNDVGRKEKEVGYKIKADLDVVPLWTDADEYFVKFRLLSPTLHLRGKHRLADFIPYESVWDSYGQSMFYAHWKNGLIEEAYLDPTELPDMLNFKKSVLSLFQFQSPSSEGEHNETDFSGDCQVLYETPALNVVRKIKRRCRRDAEGALAGAVRAARYSLGAGGELRQLHAEELLTVGHAELGLKARAWLRLDRRDAAPAPEPRAADLRAARAALPAAHRPLPLAAGDDGGGDDGDGEELEAGALATALGGREAGAGGEAAQAQALLRVLPALRRAGRAELAALLREPAHRDRLPELCALLGAAGTRTAHAAVADLLQLHAPDPALPPARAYLAALALALRPDPAVVRDVLRLAGDGRAPALAEPARLAAAAAAARAADAGDPAPAAAVRAELLAALARCPDEACRAGVLRALGNLRASDTADVLLQHAERARDAPHAALAALGALDALPPRALTFARLEALEEVALDARAPLEPRAAALDLAARRRAPLPAPLARVEHELRARGASELRRLLARRLESLAGRHAAVAELPARLERAARGWDARAVAGASSALSRRTGWAAGGWAASLDAVQVLRGGLLRRATVRLQAEREPAAAAADEPLDLLSVEVWTRGLEAFGAAEGIEPEPGAEAEDAAGGLALAVGGARGPELALFASQAELLGHVWAGTASAPTPVLRALREAFSRRGAVPLLGGGRLLVAWRGAVALALDASAQVSLWWRTARADLELRAGAALQARARLRTAWGELAAAADTDAEPRLRIAADLDFQAAVRLCVRTRTAAHAERRRVQLQSELGARRLRVRRVRESRAPRPGRTLALGRPNDDTCRTLRSADADADDADSY